MKFFLAAKKTKGHIRGVVGGVARTLEFFLKKAKK